MPGAGLDPVIPVDRLPNSEYVNLPLTIAHAKERLWQSTHRIHDVVVGKVAPHDPPSFSLRTLGFIKEVPVGCWSNAPCLLAPDCSQAPEEQFLSANNAIPAQKTA